MNETRNADIVARRGAGETLQAIGNRYRLTRERVRQIVVKHERRHREAEQHRISQESLLGREVTGQTPNP